ncbi:MAG TPA: hypothetical protein VF007_11060 [Stellaceae bacterium]
MSLPSLDTTLSADLAEPIAETPDLAERPSLAVAYLLAGGLMEALGPLFWAILGAGFLFAELGLD